MNFNISESQKNIAVALSGGGDSMALAHMMCLWAKDAGRHVHLLTVNHNLRPDAAEEAALVGEWVKDFPASSHHILTWNFSDKPDSAIMERARVARYALMIDYCKANDIRTLAVAHHANDQMETFLFRLAKGSGLDGLTGMDEWADMDGITIYRPCLHMSHEDLITYCEDNGLPWVEDPSNNDAKYARPRLRMALAEEGLDTKRFVKTLDRLARGKQALEQIADQAFDASWRANSLDWGTLERSPLDIRIRVLQKALQRTGGTQNGYSPKLERVEEIVQTLHPGKSATLYGCVLTLSKDGNRLEIAPCKA